MYPEKLAQIMLLSHESMLKVNYSQISKDHAKVLRNIFFQTFENTLSTVSITDRESECRPQDQKQMEGLHLRQEKSVTNKVL